MDILYGPHLIQQLTVNQISHCKRNPGLIWEVNTILNSQTWIVVLFLHSLYPNELFLHNLSNSFEFFKYLYFIRKGACVQYLLTIF